MTAFKNIVDPVLDTVFGTIIYSETKLDFLPHEVDSSLKEEGFVDGKLYFKKNPKFVYFETIFIYSLLKLKPHLITKTLQNYFNNLIKDNECVDYKLEMAHTINTIYLNYTKESGHFMRVLGYGLNKYTPIFWPTFIFDNLVFRTETLTKEYKFNIIKNWCENNVKMYEKLQKEAQLQNQDLNDDFENTIVEEEIKSTDNENNEVAEIIDDIPTVEHNNVRTTTSNIKTEVDLKLKPKFNYTHLFTLLITLKPIFKNIDFKSLLIHIYDFKSNSKNKSTKVFERILIEKKHKELIMYVFYQLLKLNTPKITNEKMAILFNSCFIFQQTNGEPKVYAIPTLKKEFGKIEITNPRTLSKLQKFNEKYKSLSSIG